MMDRQTIAIIPLERAVYCESCRQISNSPGETCLACDSTGALMNLARVLERKTDGDLAR